MTITTTTHSTRPSTESRPSGTTRSSKKPNSHYHPFQTTCVPSFDDPPAYATATRQRPASSLLEPHSEQLPPYSCSVSAEGIFHLQLECLSPLHTPSNPNIWREVYLVLRGTLLSIHRVKSDGPGRLLRTYSLQHAEVGLAQDSSHAVLEPRNRWASLIPASARRRAWLKDPDLFAKVSQHVLRLRAEMDQFVFAHSSEECIFSLIHALSAAIDISPDLDERSVPRQCTMPRRRRRPNRNSETVANDLSDPATVAEQERLLRQMYPAFAEQRMVEQQPQQTEAEETPVAVEEVEAPLARTTTAEEEEEELDLTAMREDIESGPSSLPDGTPSLRPTRPTASRQTTATSMISVQSSDLSRFPTNTSATIPDSANFDPETGKWRPPTARTPHQTQRYIRRCVPLLPSNAPRASDVLICHGRRVKINWRASLLEEWELEPPSYGAHGFAEAERETSSPNTAETSRTSESANSRVSTPLRRSSVDPTDDILPSPATGSTATLLPLPSGEDVDLEFVKFLSGTGSTVERVGDKVVVSSPAVPSTMTLAQRVRHQLQQQLQTPGERHAALQGVAFCF